MLSSWTLTEGGQGPLGCRSLSRVKVRVGRGFVYISLLWLVDKHPQTWRLKQHNSVVLQLWGPEVRYKSCRAKINGVTPVRIAIINKSTNNKCWGGCGEKGTLLHCWWECKLVQPLRRTVQRFLKKLNIELLYDLAIPLLGIYLEKTIIRKDTCTQCSLQHYVQ